MATFGKRTPKESFVAHLLVAIVVTVVVILVVAWSTFIFMLVLSVFRVSFPKNGMNEKRGECATTLLWRFCVEDSRKRLLNYLLWCVTCDMLMDLVWCFIIFASTHSVQPILFSGKTHSDSFLEQFSRSVALNWRSMFFSVLGHFIFISICNEVNVEIELVSSSWWRVVIWSGDWSSRWNTQPYSNLRSPLPPPPVRFITMGDPTEMMDLAAIRLNQSEIDSWLRLSNPR